MARILIIEDEIIFSTQLEQTLTNMGHEIVGNLVSTRDMEQYLSLTDLVLLDIQLNGTETGLDVAHAIAELGIPILFMTQHEDQDKYDQTKSFANSAFLVKPIHRYTLERSIELLLGHKEKESVRTYIKDGRTKNLIDHEDIQWIKVEGNYCYIKTAQKAYVFKKSLSILKQGMDTSHFVQVHRNYIVHVNHISRISASDNFIVLGDEQIPLSRRYKKELMQHTKRIF